ncbi:MAG: hypothetical protein ABIC91_00345, partial [Nanoarchaeota archaeon]
NFDDDCDGIKDDGVANCRCNGGSPTTELCNGIDDDCDTLIDEGTACCSLADSTSGYCTAVCDKTSGDSGIVFGYYLFDSGGEVASKGDCCGDDLEEYFFDFPDIVKDACCLHSTDCVADSPLPKGRCYISDAPSTVSSGGAYLCYNNVWTTCTADKACQLVGTKWKCTTPDRGVTWGWYDVSNMPAEVCDLYDNNCNGAVNDGVNCVEKCNNFDDNYNGYIDDGLTNCACTGECKGSISCSSFTYSSCPTNLNCKQQNVCDNSIFLMDFCKGLGWLYSNYQSSFGDFCTLSNLCKWVDVDYDGVPDVGSYCIRDPLQSTSDYNLVSCSSYLIDGNACAADYAYSVPDWNCAYTQSCILNPSLNPFSCVGFDKTTCLSYDYKGCDWYDGGGLTVEACNNKDDNCNQQIDEGCDDDNDNYCDASMGYSSSSLCPLGGNDCDDYTSDDSPICPINPPLDIIDELCDEKENSKCAICVNPGASEICDGFNNDCDSDIDEGLNPDSCAYTCNNNVADQTPYDLGGIAFDSSLFSGDNTVSTKNCCGDDANEYYRVVNDVEACCAYEDSCVDVEGNCYDPGTISLEDINLCHAFPNPFGGAWFSLLIECSDIEQCNSYDSYTCVNDGAKWSWRQTMPIEVCDGVDNDCDGVKDDGLTNCACANDGSPSLDGEVCDEIDNDCDGYIDEEGVCGDIQITYFYDNDCGNADEINSWGRICKVIDMSGTYLFEYDNKGRVIKETRADNFVNLVMDPGFQYDLDYWNIWSAYNNAANPCARVVNNQAELSVSPYGSCSLDQSLSIEKGKEYTLSAEVMILDVPSSYVGAYVRCRYDANGDGLYSDLDEDGYVWPITPENVGEDHYNDSWAGANLALTNSWQTISVSFDPEDSSNGDRILDCVLNLRLHSAEVTTNTGKVYFDYVQLEESSSKTEFVRNTFITTYDYDSAGNVKTIIDPAGVKTEYFYNLLSQVDSVQVTTPNGKVKTLSYNYYPAGNIKDINYDNLITTVFEYYERDWVKSIKTNPVGGSVGSFFDETYAYDDEGNIETIDFMDGTLESVTFGYDSLDRLTTVTDNEYFDTSIFYDYDDNSNRLFRTIDGQKSSYLYASGTNKMTSDGVYTYTYDLNGNVKTKTDSSNYRIVFYYDADNRLISVDFGNDGIIEVEYVYNFKGQRVRATTFDTVENEFVNNIYVFGLDNNLIYEDLVAVGNCDISTFDSSKNFVVKANGVVVASLDTNGIWLLKGEIIYTLPTTKAFKITNSNDAVVAAIDGDGNLYLRSELKLNEKLDDNVNYVQDPAAKDFIIKSGTKTIAVFDESGNLYLRGCVAENMLS